MTKNGDDVVNVDIKLPRPVSPPPVATIPQRRGRPPKSAASTFDQADVTTCLRRSERKTAGKPPERLSLLADVERLEPQDWVEDWIIRSGL